GSGGPEPRGWRASRGRPERAGKGSIAIPDLASIGLGRESPSDAPWQPPGSWALRQRRTHLNVSPDGPDAAGSHPHRARWVGGVAELPRPRDSWPDCNCGDRDSRAGWGFGNLGLLLRAPVGGHRLAIDCPGMLGVGAGPGSSVARDRQ